MVAQNANRIASRQQRLPAFFWQGILIVAPVMVLAGLGLFSLRQDKILAQHEATERAQAIADELARNIWSELTEVRDPNLPSFKMGQDRKLLLPASYPPVPIPQPLDLAELNAAQTRLWETVQAAEREQNVSTAIQA